MTLDDALKGTTAPFNVIEQLTIVDVPYHSFTGKTVSGQLVINKHLASEVHDIFEQLLILRFPIEKMIPVVHYNWSDEASMSDNNTSSFNYRLISGTNSPSNHGLGRAIDINPRVNPYFGRLGIEPAGASYDKSAKGVILAHSPIVKLFEERGWTWLGYRDEYPDYQHFQKP